MTWSHPETLLVFMASHIFSSDGKVARAIIILQILKFSNLEDSSSSWKFLCSLCCFEYVIKEKVAEKDRRRESERGIWMSENTFQCMEACWKMGRERAGHVHWPGQNICFKQLDDIDLDHNPVTMEICSRWEILQTFCALVNGFQHGISLPHKTQWQFFSHDILRLMGGSLVHLWQGQTQPCTFLSEAADQVGHSLSRVLLFVTWVVSGQLKLELFVLLKLGNERSASWSDSSLRLALLVK